MDQTTEQAVPVALDHLDARAAELDAQAGQADGTAPPAEAVATPDYLHESRGAVDMFAALVIGFCPTCATVWDHGTKDRVAGALSPVMEKYGVSFGALPPEILLVIIAGPPLYQSARLVASHLADKKAEAEKKKAAEEKKNGPNNDVFDAQNTGRQQVIRPTAKEPEGPTVAMHPQMALYQK